MEGFVLERTENRRYLSIIVVLLIALLALLYLYYLLTKPPTIVGREREKVGFNNVFSIYGFRDDRLSRPSDVAVDEDGNIYVADSNKHRIVVFNSGGAYVTKFGIAGKGKGQLWFPGGVAVDKDGNVFVLSKPLNKVVIYGRNHQPKWEISVSSPEAVRVANNRLYITTDRGVMIGTLKGEPIASFGRRGKSLGQVDMPTGIAVDKKGNIYLADSLNYRVQAFNSDGKSIWALGAPPPPEQDIKYANRTFGLPAGLVLADDGLLYLVDAFTGEIILINTKGKEVAKVGDWGHDDGQLYYPAGIAYAGNERFVIADKFNDRVQVVRIPSPVVRPAERARRLILSPYFLIPLILLILLLVVWWWRNRAKRKLQEELQATY